MAVLGVVTLTRSQLYCGYHSLMSLENSVITLAIETFRANDGEISNYSINKFLLISFKGWVKKME